MFDEFYFPSTPLWEGGWFTSGSKILTPLIAALIENSALIEVQIAALIQDSCKKHGKSSLLPTHCFSILMQVPKKTHFRALIPN